MREELSPSPALPLYTMLLETRFSGPAPTPGTSHTNTHTTQKMLQAM